MEERIDYRRHPRASNEVEFHSTPTVMVSISPESKMPPATSAIVYGVSAGSGGLGHSVASAITALTAHSHKVTALGPGYHQPWSLPGGLPACEWLQSPALIPAWKRKFTSLRWRSGELIFQHDSRLGKWAASQVRQQSPESCYVFTQIGLETLEWTNKEPIFAVVDNPNGHIQNYREICERESLRWCGKKYEGHPTAAMVDRVKEEYHLADCVRVYSEWGQRSMTDFGVPAEKIEIVQQTINLDRFCEPAEKPPAAGPLRVCYVGSLDLRKGFVYLLRAIRAIGASHVSLDIVGATGNRNCARLFDRERQGLQVQCAPGDPLRAYHNSDIFVAPTLEDGLPFVLPEAMACGLPVIATNQCGAGECVREDREGWIVPSADVDALAGALEKAIERRKDLPEMGRNARQTVETYCGPSHMDRLANWFYSRSSSSACRNS